jgi:hypothetical protein
MRIAQRRYNLMKDISKEEIEHIIGKQTGATRV